MSLSDKIFYGSLPLYADGVFIKEDVREAVKELKEKINKNYGKGKGRTLLSRYSCNLWVDEIFGEKLI